MTVSDLRPVEAEDLLGRDPVAPNATLLARNIAGKSVLVTGAGGSIGSELVRQILRQGPRRLVLLDAGEGPLYEIEREARERLHAKRPASMPDGAAPPEIVAVLGSIQNSALVRRTIESNAVETIYHAAAYKHVPIVEHNAVAGLRNNTFGTCRAGGGGGGAGRRALRAGVDGQGRAADEHHGRQQAPGRDGAAGAVPPTATASAPCSRWCASATCSTARARWCACSAARSRRAGR